MKCPSSAILANVALYHLFGFPLDLRVVNPGGDSDVIRDTEFGKVALADSV